MAGLLMTDADRWLYCPDTYSRGLDVKTLVRGARPNRYLSAPPVPEAPDPEAQ
jgi:hypothetical protein